MSYELQGKLTEIFKTEQVTEKFCKREFVLEKLETSGDKTFTETIKFQMTQDRCDLIDPYKVGEDVKVHFNIKGRAWENKDGKTNYFTNLEAWRIEKVEGTSQSNVDDIQPEDDVDSLPF